jgi:hypothetical protein
MLLGHHRCSTGTCGGHVVQVACCRRPVCSICDSDWYCHKCGLCKQVMCTMLLGVLKAVSAGRCLCFRSNPFQLVLYRQALRLNTSAPAAEPHTFSVQANPCLQASNVNRGGSGYALCLMCNPLLPTSCRPTVLLHQDSTSAAVQARQALALVEL